MTIEERAEQLAEEMFPDTLNIWARPNVNKSMTKSNLILFAKEQKQIDMENACYVYCNQCNLIYNIQFGKDCQIERKFCHRLNEFRKTLQAKEE